LNFAVRFNVFVPPFAGIFSTPPGFNEKSIGLIRAGSPERGPQMTPDFF
jgi:hypothetical protein